MSRVLEIRSEGLTIPLHGSFDDKRKIVRLFRGEPLHRMKTLSTLIEKAEKYEQLQKEVGRLRAALRATDELVTAAQLVLETREEASEHALSEQVPPTIPIYRKSEAQKVRLASEVG